MPSSLPLPAGMPLATEDNKSKSERRPWSAEEDAQITASVATHGTCSWALVATMLPTRTGKQCRERWHNHLDPSINKDEWTLEENKTLLAAHLSMGNKWADIAKTLPGRTDNQVKNHWSSALRRELRKLNRLANKHKGAVAEAMAAATAAAIAVSGDKETGLDSGDKETGLANDVTASDVSRESLGAVLCELTNPTAAGGAAKPCKKKETSLQMTATALEAATAVQETLLDAYASQPLPHGCTEEDVANAKLLLAHMKEFNAAWAAAADEGARTGKLKEHVDWLSEFNTSLVEKALLRRSEPKPKEAPKRKRAKAAASEDAADGKTDGAPAKRRRGGKRAAPAKADSEAEEEEEMPEMSVADVLRMAAHSGCAEWPLATMPLATPAAASQPNSPLAIYETDFSHAGCFASPHHFLSPRSVAQLSSECLSAVVTTPSPLAPSVSSATSATSIGGTSGGSGSARSAAEVAAAVYDALGGLATLAAAAPPKPVGSSRPSYDAAELSSLDVYAGAGVAQRRKPAGMGDLCLPMTGAAGPISAGPISGVSAISALSPLPSAGPISARSIELSALLSPALGELGVLGTFPLCSPPPTPPPPPPQ